METDRQTESSRERERERKQSGGGGRKKEGCGAVGMEEVQSGEGR